LVAEAETLSKSQDPVEQRRLLETLLSNCTFDRAIAEVLVLQSLGQSIGPPWQAKRERAAAALAQGSLSKKR